MNRMYISQLASKCTTLAMKLHIKKTKKNKKKGS